MKKYMAALLLTLSMLQTACAQVPDLTVIKDIPALDITDQGQSGTCWSFSTTSFLESEVIRLKGEKIGLSEMFFVRAAYRLKAQNYILRQGTARFSEGGLAHDPFIGLTGTGMVPRTVYTGLLPRKKRHNHARLFSILDSTVKTYTPAAKRGAAWRQELPGIMDKFMGKAPAEFTYDGNTYTPKTFLAYTGIKAADYVTVTSFSHSPFYQPFVLSLPANWAYERFYNLPLEEFIANIDHAIMGGYSLVLDLDGTEPTLKVEQGFGTWPDNKVTQEKRQQAFENFDTTDDHLMHIVGIVKDATGITYYKCKNSWGIQNGLKGYLYLSKDYVRMKGISVLLHKDGLLAVTRKRSELAGENQR